MERAAKRLQPIPYQPSDRRCLWVPPRQRPSVLEILEPLAVGSRANSAGPSTTLLNDFRGVQIQDAPNNTLGGTTPGAGNVISGNISHGIRIVGTGATGNLIQGNTIGVNATGTGPMGNSEAGIAISACNNTVGGLPAGAGNLIAYNGFDGVFVDSGGGFVAVSNALLGNSIHNNSGMGIPC